MALTDKLTAIANAIRAKTGKTGTLTLDQMPTEIAGITGGGTDVTIIPNVEIALDFTDGDILIDAGEGYAVRTATIFKPDTLKPENIKAGVTIAGIVGTHEGGGGSAGGNYVAFGGISNTAAWLLDTDGVLLIQGSGAMADYSSASEQPWYEFAGDITSVVIGDGITSVGAYAFLGCTGLTSVTIPESVTSIGKYAFYGCTGLTGIVIPSSVTSMGSIVFGGCANLASANIPANMTTVPEYMFYNCPALTGITIPHGVTSIGKYAFDGCASITSITFPDSVTSIGYGSFRNSGLTSITIPSNLTSIGGNSFNGCSLTYAKFAVTTGWKYNIMGNLYSLPSSDLATTSKAAESLTTSSYAPYSWTRT